MTRLHRSVFLLLAVCLAAYAAQVDTLRMSSAVLGRTIVYIAIRPSGYAAAVADRTPFPVLYLLHCAGCDHLSWIDNGYCDGLAAAVDRHRIIAVAPYDGGKYSWWLDSPLLNDSRMSQFLVRELKPHIDSVYYTLPDRSNTAIAGHSMGGFGALHNAMYYPGVFGIAVSIKGGIDPLNPSWPSDFGLTRVLGSRQTNLARWQWASVLHNTLRFKDTYTRIRIFNGLQDAWFARENAALHDTLTRRGIAHTYTPLREDHFGVSREVIDGTLAFCDSSATRTGIRQKVPLRLPLGPYPGTTRHTGLALRRNSPAAHFFHAQGVMVNQRGKHIASTTDKNIACGVYFVKNGPAGFVDTYQRIVVF